MSNPNPHGNASGGHTSNADGPMGMCRPSRAKGVLMINRLKSFVKGISHRWAPAERNTSTRDAAQPRPDNTIQENLRVWSSHDWRRRGDEWSNTDDWKRSLIQWILEPHIPRGSAVLEIGPGAGRWTEYLVPRTSRLFLVDLTPKCIELCKERFKNERHLEYYVNDGRSLDFIPDETLDRIWSWDVFVHIQSVDVENYVRQFARILKKNGMGAIHHAKNGVTEFHGGWRSDMTADRMVDYCSRHGFRVISQFDCWENGKYCIWPTLSKEVQPDVITIFKKL